MLIIQPRSKKNQNGPRTSLMGPGGVVWEKKNEYKKSRETVPLKWHGLDGIFLDEDSMHAGLLLVDICLLRSGPLLVTTVFTLANLYPEADFFSVKRHVYLYEDAHLLYKMDIFIQINMPFYTKKSCL